MNRTVIPLACRAELLLSLFPGSEPDRYTLNNIRTGDCYTLGGHEYFLLGRLGGQTAADLCRAFQERFGEELSEGELHDEQIVRRDDEPEFLGAYEVVGALSGVELVAEVGEA